MLLIFSGLPATGKTTLAKEIAKTLHATFIRIDTVENAIKNSSLKPKDVLDAGYNVGYQLARDHLLANNIVVADSVNSIEITRAAWRKCAIETKKSYIEIEVICSNKVEHQERAESRISDLQNFNLPTWQNILSRKYEPKKEHRIIIDTANNSVDQSVAELLTQIEEFKKNNFKGN